MASKSSKKIDRKLFVGGVGVFGGSKKQVLEMVAEQLVSGRKNENHEPLLVTTPNPEQVVLAQFNDTFRSILNDSLAVADGVGLVWAANLVARKKRVGIQEERITGIDLAEEIVGLCKARGNRVLLLGGEEGIASRASERFQDNESESGFKVVGLSGYKDVRNQASSETKAIFEQIKDFKPGGLLVGYGAPWQEEWIWNYRQELGRLGLKVTMVVGGSLDVWAGKVSRAPKWMREFGLEWLWRLMRQPWRWKRQLRLFSFVKMVVGEWFR